MASDVLKLSVVLLAIGVCDADLLYSQSRLVTEECLGCICQAVSGCMQSIQCEGDTCGLFYIRRSYWASAGNPTINNQNPNASDAYSTCTIDPVCAATTVQNYMQRFARDCNNDGQVDCYDYLAIHKLGPYGCHGQLSSKLLGVFNQCLSLVTNQAIIQELNEVPKY